MRAVRPAKIFARWVAKAALCGVALGVAAQSAAAQAPQVGDAVANPAVLARLFAATCFQSGNLAEAQAMLANAGMVPNPETGTYFHQQFDMSVNPNGPLCSMVFAAEAEGPDGEAFRASAGQVIGDLTADVEIIRIEEVDGLYMRAGTEARW